MASNKISPPAQINYSRVQSKASMESGDKFLILDAADGDNPKTITNGLFIPNGTYTPLVTGTANLDAVSIPSVWKYTQIGSMVFFTGNVTVDPTAAATPTTFRVDLPIASNFDTGSDAVGNLIRASNNTEAGTAVADTTNDQITFTFTSTITTSHNVVCWGWYFIK